MKPYFLTNVSITETLNFLSTDTCPKQKDSPFDSDSTPIQLVCDANSLEIMAIRGNVTAVKNISRTALIGVPSCFPVSSIVHVFDEEYFEKINSINEQLVADNNLLRLASYVAIAELFTYLNEVRASPPSAIASLYSRTFSYALFRSKQVWPNAKHDELFERWSDVRRLTGWTENSLLPEILTRQAALFWAGEDLSTFEWSIPLVKKGNEYKDREFSEIAISTIFEKFGIQLTPFPVSFDTRFSWLTQSILLLNKKNISATQVGFIIGLLVAMLEPGELMHLNWLRPHLPQFPCAAMHYAGWSASIAKNSVSVTVLNGLARRIGRDLSRPFSLTEPPREDASWIDLLAAGEIVEEGQIRANGRSFSVSLVPGVLIEASLNTRSLDNLVKRINHQVASFKKNEPQGALFPVESPLPQNELILTVLQKIEELKLAFEAERPAKKRSVSIKK